MLGRALLSALLCAPLSCAYSVLSHQAIVDSAWNDSIKPILLTRYKSATAEDLRSALAHAYGGAIIPDMGYYPFGSHLFSDLVHYVRGGDFIENMLSEAKNLDEYAFALGSLAHYAADSLGHPAVNRAVSLTYPKLRREFGRTVTYADDAASHLKVEFGFDVLQVANGRYAPDVYRDFIGFQVAKPVLERAFFLTFGVELKDVFLSVDLALGTYRFTVGSIIPQMTRIAWEVKKGQLIRETPGLTRNKFVYSLSRAAYEKEWGAEYERPGLCARLVASLFRLIPKFGPFKVLGFRPPTPETEKLFMESFVKTVGEYRTLLNQVRKADRLTLTNDNFDTGKISRYSDYRLADEAYAQLVERLNQKQPGEVDPLLRQAILDFYYGFVPAKAAQLERFERLHAR